MTESMSISRCSMSSLIWHSQTDCRLLGNPFDVAWLYGVVFAELWFYSWVVINNDERWLKVYAPCDWNGEERFGARGSPSGMRDCSPPKSDCVITQPYLHNQKCDYALRNQLHKRTGKRLGSRWLHSLCYCRTLHNVCFCLKVSRCQECSLRLWQRQIWWQWLSLKLAFA